jgi:hypothetical protein
VQTKSLQETLAHKKNDLHEEAWTLKVEIRVSQERMETKIKAPDVSSRHSLEKLRLEPILEEKRTGAGQTKPPKFNGTIS